jgi:SMI1-KNR4 cell-wall
MKMSSLKALMQLMRPPAGPSETPSGDEWQSVEARLGMELPEDYKEFVTRYGTGAVDSFLWILNPFSQNDNLNLISQARTRLDAQRQFSEETGTTSPYALYPNANGLFPWGVTDNGDVLYWLCKGSPSSWSIVACDSRSSRWREFRLSTAEFLVALLTRRLFVDGFPDDFPSEPPEFAPLQLQ